MHNIADEWTEKLKIVSTSDLKSHQSKQVAHNNQALLKLTPDVTVNANNQVEYMEVEEELNSTNQVTSRSPNPFEKVFIKILEKSGKLNTDVEQNSTKKDNLEKTNKSNKQQRSYQEMKKELRSLVKTPVSNCQNAVKTSSKLKCSTVFFKLFKMIFLLLPLLFLIFSTILYYNDNHKHSSDYVNAIAELKREIYGQDQAIQTLTEYLELDTPSLKVIALVGGTGVGKSHTVQIIRENFPREYTVSQYYPPIKNVRNIIFSFLYPDLIILENLKEHDLTDVIDFLKRRQDVSSDRYITVLAVFNIEQMDVELTRNIDWNHSLDLIKNAFADGNIDVKIIPYTFLSEDALEQCITKQMMDSGLTLSDEQFNLVKQYLLTNNAGCKGAYRKVQLIGRQ